MRKISFCFLLALLLLQIESAAQYNGKHEWRAAWIATVNNIDWPSAPGLNSAAQRRELLQYLDLFKSLNFNAIILQIRPTADAFYISGYEPWSIYLTGDQSKAPDPLYDPLSFAIEEAHKRGMELHAWLNPYRVTQDTANLAFVAEDHILRKHPEWFVRHGKKLYFDPAFPQTREFLTSVIKDLVTRYDLDGIHFDDYFYPNNDFDDSYSFRIHSRGYPAEKRAEWRRENVDMVVKMLRDTIKSVKPYVKFGISPYAVWRNLREDPRGSDTKSYSYTNYDHLHADILLWMQKGWVDYILPQFYFNIGYENADFRTLVKWWEENAAGTPLYAGIATYKLDKNSKIPAWRNTAEIKNQLEMIRRSKGYQGVCYFSAKDFRTNRLGINNLISQLYSNPALVPPLRGFDTIPPAPVDKATLRQEKGEVKFEWSLKESDSVEDQTIYYYALYRFKKGEKIDFTRGEALFCLTGEQKTAVKMTDAGEYEFWVTALDRLFNESTPVKFKRTK